MINKIKFQIKEDLKEIPLAMFFYRVYLVLVYLWPPLRKAVIWLFKDREITNFTYDLTKINKKYLSQTISLITGKDSKEIEKYIKEITNNKSLKQHIKKQIKQSSQISRSNSEVNFGKRIGWYAMVRAVKPKIVVETGVEHGLGSCVLTEALIKNEQEGFPGKYYGTDIDNNAGQLFSGKYTKYGEILYGDSIESLKNLKNKIDVFINDSDHSAEYEQREYETIENKLRQNSIILGDNSHVTDKLSNFALKTNRSFIFFKESPLNHWYPGGGIGFAFKKKK